MVRLEAKTPASPREVQEALSNLKADLIHADGLSGSQGFFGVIMFEKKYWRAQSYSSLSVMVKKVEGEDHTRITMVSSTERQDNILISLFASSEKAFAREALETLQQSLEIYDVTEDDRHNVWEFNPDL